MEFEINENFEADEIDLLVLYLDNGFNIGNAEFTSQVLQMYGISNDLDVFYARNPNAKNVKKPKRKLSTLWVDIIRQIESRKKKGWLRISYILYNVQFDDQKKIEKGIKEVYKYLKKQGSLGRKDYAVFLTSGPEKRRDGLVFVGYKKLTKQERLNRLRVYGEEILEKSKSKDAVIMAFDIKKLIYPYNVIALIG